MRIATLVRFPDRPSIARGGVRGTRQKVRLTHLLSKNGSRLHSSIGRALDSGPSGVNRWLQVRILLKARGDGKWTVIHGCPSPCQNERRKIMWMNLVVWFVGLPVTGLIAEAAARWNWSER